MRITYWLLVSALVGSLAGCLVRARPYDTTTAREVRTCQPSHHWNGDRCVPDRRDRDRDRDRDHDGDHDRH
jgi:hypothetical protein